ncbi:TdcA1-ORF1-ORF2 protein [Corchorus olitorius]|uniref:TdcA1-ORF1-ORF2 protein n=1 Tax=Corchorus olitorius TaxID=93759 RepID=A0A1R3GQW0_9ROSI|nr:TdcA1-ORF1-ORF2 protein [Corchorus olitorius]
MFFADWFKLYVQTRENAVTDPLLQDLAWPPSNKATSWPAYMVNGYNFHTFVHGQGRATINSGICVCGSDSNDPSHDFYGILKDVVQIEYCGSTFSMNVVLFEASKEESDQDATAYQVDDILHAPSVSISEQIPSLFDQLQGLTLEVDLGILPQSVPSELPTDEEEFESEETSDDEDDVDPSNDY